MGNFNMLPEENQIEILSRLPVESVLECKLVSKPWKNLLQHPSFSQMHFNHHHLDSSSGNLISCIFYSRQPYINEFHYSVYDENSHEDEFYYSEYDENSHEAPFNRRTRMNLGPPFVNSSIIGSCNGLICFSRRVEKGFHECENGPAYICNPITREYIILPDYEGEYRWNGFGCSSMTNEYKVVRICKTRGEANVGIVQVYTLGSGKGWRNAGKINIIMQHSCAGVFVNGALHWARKNKGGILAFRLDNEKFCVLPPAPPCLVRADIPYSDTELAVLGGFLSVTYDYYSGDCDILLLKKNGDNNNFSWNIEFSSDSYIPGPFEFTRSGRLLCYERRKLYIYDPKASSVKMDVSFGKNIFQAISHKNTLVSLKALGEMDTKVMESCERASSSEATNNNGKPKEQQNRVRDV